MKVTWLGQGGILLDTGRLRILVDPYFSDSVKKVNPKNFRRLPLESWVWGIQPDVMVFTHDHLDHYDPETAPVFLQRDREMTVLAPGALWGKARQLGGAHNYVQFNRHTRWTEQGVRFTAVKAEHSDPDAIGVVIDDGETTLYITGDTLYNETVFSDLPRNIDAVFLPVNGVGNNMNMTDAADFARRIGAKQVVPIHYGMFDQLDIREFSCENQRILTPYKEEIV